MIDKNKLRRILNLFMDEEDLKALNVLYKATEDPLVKILINWKNEYEELKCCQTNEFYMYDDIISYLFKKYELNKI